MLFHNKKLLNKVSILTLIAFCFCFINSSLYATDWDKIKRDGDRVIDNFYNVLEEDSYVVTLENIFYHKISEKNKKEPIPKERIMREAKAKIEESGEKATKEKIQKKFVELIVIEVFTPLTQKLNKILKDNNVNYKDISKNVDYPQGTNEIIRALGFGIGGAVVSTVIIATVVTIQIKCMALTTWVVASIAAWWAGTTLVGATAGSTILGPWGIATVLVVGGTTTYFYIRSKLKEAEENEAKAFKELKAVIGNSEAEIRAQWLKSINDLKEKENN